MAKVKSEKLAAGKNRRGIEEAEFWEKQDMAYRRRNLRRAKVAARLLALVPFLRLAGLNGSIVRAEETPESDIDFLIIARSGRLYTTRFFATSLVHLTGWRRHGKKVAGRICLNCYLNDEHPTLIPSNPVSCFRVAEANKHFVPLVGDKETEEKFWRANGWFGSFKVEGEEYAEGLRRNLAKRGLRRRLVISEVFLRGNFGDWLEKKLMDYQMRRIICGAQEGDEVVATEEEIRLHPRK